MLFSLVSLASASFLQLVVLRSKTEFVPFQFLFRILSKVSSCWSYSCSLCKSGNSAHLIYMGLASIPLTGWMGQCILSWQTCKDLRRQKILMDNSFFLKDASLYSTTS